VLAAMGEAAERTDGSLAAIRESLDLVHAQMGSMDARLGQLDNAYQQVASQMDLQARAVSDHTRVMDAIERRQESLAQQMAATAEAIARLGGSKPSSVVEEEDGEHARFAGKGIMQPVPTGTYRGAPASGNFHPGSSSSTRPPDLARVPELQYLDAPCRTPGQGAPPPHTGGLPASGEQGRAGEHATGKVPIKMNFPRFDGEFPRIWRDKCLDYFRVCNIHPTMWLTAATMHLEGNAAHWFQAYKLKHAVQGWPDFILAVEAQFGVHDHRQFMTDLLALKQTGLVSEYCTKFQELVYKLSGHNPYYDDTFFVSQFLKGLKAEIRLPVASQIPETLDRAILLAHVQQDLQSQQRPWAARQPAAQRPEPVPP
jgi:hypothetical protein